MVSSTGHQEPGRRVRGLSNLFGFLTTSAPQTYSRDQAPNGYRRPFTEDEAEDVSYGSIPGGFQEPSLQEPSHTYRPKRNMIAIMGSTGAGKSSFINVATNTRTMMVGDDLESCTAKVKQAMFSFQGHNITFVDTPGFDDSSKSDAKVLGEIARWMMAQYALGLKLTGIIYLLPIDTVRMKGSEGLTQELFVELCGSYNLKNVILVSTKWDTIDPNLGARREQQLADTYWADLLGCGAQMARHYNTTKSARAILQRLVELPDIEGGLKIQRELIDEGKTLYETGAGGKLKEALKAQAEKMQAEFDRKEKAMKKAEEDALRREAESRKKNDEANRKLQQELAAVRATQEEAIKSHNLKLKVELEQQAANLQETFNQKQTESEKRRAEEVAANTKFKQNLERQTAEILNQLKENNADSARLDKSRDAEITQLKALIKQLQKEAKERNVSVSDYVWSGLESARNGVSNTWNNVSSWFSY